MAQAQQSFSRNIQALFDTGATGDLTDRQLIERFRARENEAAEQAFTVLAERHGPMVFHACRSIFHDRHAAEDAYQATFLILSRKAGSLWFPRRGLAPAILPVGASLVLSTVPASLAALTVEIAVRFAAGPPATGMATSAIALSEGVIAIMLMSKLKLILAVILTGGFIVSGTALLGPRALGLYQATPAKAKSQPETPAGAQGKLNPPAEPEPELLSPNAKARIEIARKLRDDTYLQFQQGETDLIAYLDAQRRLDDVIGAVTVKSDADRVRYNEVKVIGLKRLEQSVREAHSRGEKPEREALTIELDRLDRS